MEFGAAGGFNVVLVFIAIASGPTPNSPPLPRQLIFSTGTTIPTPIIWSTRMHVGVRVNLETVDANLVRDKVFDIGESGHKVVESLVQITIFVE